MTIKNIAIIGTVVIALGSGALYMKNSQSQQTAMMEKKEAQMDKEVMPKTDGTKEMMETPTDAMEKPDAMMKKESRYIEYSPMSFEKAKDKKRVYFFHATWCPTCKSTNTEFTEKSEGIPTDVVVFKTDYDTNAALKKQYAITYQHTFVLVDENGKEVKKWNGGAIAELVANTK